MSDVERRLVEDIRNNLVQPAHMQPLREWRTEMAEVIARDLIASGWMKITVPAEGTYSYAVAAASKDAATRAEWLANRDKR